MVDPKFLDNRNVIDEYKGLPNEEIVRLVQAKSLPFGICMQHLEGDYNLGTVLRNANGFGAREFFYLGGRKQWDRRSSMGTQHYTKMQFLRDVEDLRKLKDRYRFICVENGVGGKDISKHKWEPNSLLIFGEASRGVLPEVIEMSDAIVEIAQYGSVRSINVGTASGIAMHLAATSLAG